MAPLLGSSYAEYQKDFGKRVYFLKAGWDTVKNGFISDSPGAFTIPLGSLYETIKYNWDAGMEALKQKHGDNVTRPSRTPNQISIKSPVINKIFEAVLTPLRKILTDLFARQKPDFVFLVGGMGSNHYIRETLEKFCEDNYKIPLFCPQDAGTSIVRGAVRFGLDSQAFGSRKARTNYGLELHNSSDPSNNFFSILIKKGSNLKDLAVKTKQDPLGPYTPLTLDQTSVRFSIWESDDADVNFVTDPRCVLVAEMCADVNMTAQTIDDRAFQIVLSMDGPAISGEVSQINYPDIKHQIKWSSR